MYTSKILPAQNGVVTATVTVSTTTTILMIFLVLVFIPYPFEMYFPKPVRGSLEQLRCFLWKKEVETSVHFFEEDRFDSYDCDLTQELVVSKGDNIPFRIRTLEGICFLETNRDQEILDRGVETKRDR